MPTLTTPFWTITDRTAGIPLPMASECASGHIVAFTDPEKAFDYASWKGHPAPEIELVSIRTAETFVEMLRLLGVRGFCIDPRDGDCAGLVPLRAFGVQG